MDRPGGQQHLRPNREKLTAAAAESIAAPGWGRVTIRAAILEAA